MNEDMNEYGKTPNPMDFAEMASQMRRERATATAALSSSIGQKPTLLALKLENVAAAIRHSDRFQDGKQGPELAENWAKTIERGAYILENFSEDEPTMTHPDDEKIGAFVVAMKEKMANSREAGLQDWESASVLVISQHLLWQVEKGDPVNVAILCMMLWHADGSIAQYESPEEDAAIAALRNLRDALRDKHYGRMPEEVQRAYDEANEVISDHSAQK